VAGRGRSLIAAGEAVGRGWIGDIQTVPTDLDVAADIGLALVAAREVIGRAWSRQRLGAEHQQVELCWWRVCGQEGAQLISVVGGSASREAVRQAELEQRLMHCRDR